MLLASHNYFFDHQVQNSDSRRIIWRGRITRHRICIDAPWWFGLLSTAGSHDCTAVWTRLDRGSSLERWEGCLAQVDRQCSHPVGQYWDRPSLAQLWRYSGLECLASIKPLGWNFGEICMIQEAQAAQHEPFPVVVMVWMCEREGLKASRRKIW